MTDEVLRGQRGRYGGRENKEKEEKKVEEGGVEEGEHSPSPPKNEYKQGEVKIGALAFLHIRFPTEYSHVRTMSLTKQHQTAIHSQAPCY